MRILILGGSGMLGHRLLTLAHREHEVWTTLRGTADQIPRWLDFDRAKVFEKIDALNIDSIASILSHVKPDVVINCIGIIKQSPLAKDPLPALLVNSVLPHKLALLCRVERTRLVCISTDCVFSGSKGNYVESDDSDATDLYGRTKYLGEVTYPNAITLRTSIIGRELRTRLGLIEWFLNQHGKVKGFTRAIYSGLTTDELSRVILKYILPNKELQGLYHVSCNPINKCDLLEIAKEAFMHEIPIERDGSFICDRSLNSERFRAHTGYSPPSMRHMIEELAQCSAQYGKNPGTLS